MSRPIYKWAAVLQVALVLLTGCHPTQPYFMARDESLATYVAQSMDIEYADVTTESLPEASQAALPFGPENMPTEFRDISLEECIAFALQNTKIIRVVNGSNLQSGSVAAQILSATPGSLPSIYDPALVHTTANTQPLAIDGQGNRIAPRGFTRSNQVGGVEDALSEFDAQWSALFGYNTTDRPRNVGRQNVFNPQEFQAVESNAQVAVSKRMATGTIATARFATIYSRNNIPASGNAPNSGNLGRSVPSDYTATVDLSITQPLLRGRGTLVNRIPVILARANEEIETHRFQANVRNLVKAVEDAYWDLYFAYRSFESSREAFEAATDLWRVSEERTRLSDTPPQAEAQARGQYYTFRGAMQDAMFGASSVGNPGILGREQTLRELMGLSATDCVLLRPSDEPTTARVDFDWCQIRGEALTRSTELRLHKWAIKQEELELMAAKNQILPQLDAVFGYRFVGVGDEFATEDGRGIDFPDPGSTAIEGLVGGRSQEVVAQLQYTPQAQGKRRALANIQNSRIQLKKLHIEYQEKEIMLIGQLTRAWQARDSAYIGMKTSFDEWEASEDEISIYNANIEGDVGELGQLVDALLRAQERRSRAQASYFQAVTDYNKALVNIHYLKGSILALNNIGLAEGPWVDKAYWDAEERASERASGIYFDYGYTRPAVVSNGPVEQGMLTEGNISRQNASYPEPPQPVEPEEVQPQQPGGDGGDDELKPLPPRRGAVAARPGGRLTSNASQTPGFNWGGLGLDGAQPARQQPQAAPVLPASTTSAPANTLRDDSSRSAVAAPVIPAQSVQQAWQPRN